MSHFIIKIVLPVNCTPAQPFQKVRIGILGQNSTENHDAEWEKGFIEIFRNGTVTKQED